MKNHIQSNLSWDHLRITTTCLQQPLFWSLSFSLSNNKVPFNNSSHKFRAQRVWFGCILKYNNISRGIQMTSSSTNIYLFHRRFFTLTDAASSMLLLWCRCNDGNNMQEKRQSLPHDSYVVNFKNYKTISCNFNKFQIN